MTVATAVATATLPPTSIGYAGGVTRARSLDHGLALAALVAIYTVSLTISPRLVERSPLVPAAIAFDLRITAALATYLLGVRRAGWPSWSVAAVLLVGSVTAHVAVPAVGAGTLLVVSVATVDLVLAALIAARLPRLVRAARAHAGPGPVAKVEAGLLAVGIPARVASFLAVDVVAIGLGLSGWFRRPAPGGFSMHRRKSLAAILAVFAALCLIETAALHLVVAPASPVVAWVLTGLAIYGALWLAGDFHAVRLYPLRITADEVQVSVGLRTRLRIPRAAIVRISATDTCPPGAGSLRVVEPTTLVELDRELEARGLFGVRRRARAFALTVDDHDGLCAALGHADAPSR